jgi:hypothetical protein
MKDLRKKEVNWSRIFRGFLAYGTGIGLGIFLVWALWLRNRDIPNFWPGGMVREKIVESTIETNNINTCYLNCLGTTDSSLRILIKRADVKMPPARRQPYPVYGITTLSSTGEKVRLWIESKDSTYNIFKIEDLPGTTKNHDCKCEEVNF